MSGIQRAGNHPSSIPSQSPTTLDPRSKDYGDDEQSRILLRHVPCRSPFRSPSFPPPRHPQALLLGIQADEQGVNNRKKTIQALDPRPKDYGDDEPGKVKGSKSTTNNSGRVCICTYPSNLWKFTAPGGTAEELLLARTLGLYYN